MRKQPLTPSYDKKTVENEKHIRLILEQQTLLHQKLDRILQALKGMKPDQEGEEEG